MNEEVQIDIVNLFHYILKKWQHSCDSYACAWCDS